MRARAALQDGDPTHEHRKRLTLSRRTLLQGTACAAATTTLGLPQLIRAAIGDPSRVASAPAAPPSCSNASRHTVTATSPALRASAAKRSKEFVVIRLEPEPEAGAGAGPVFGCRVLIGPATAA